MIIGVVFEDCFDLQNENSNAHSKIAEAGMWAKRANFAEMLGSRPSLESLRGISGALFSDLADSLEKRVGRTWEANEVLVGSFMAV